jgi:spectinomycin phosphotransferase
MLEKPDLDEEKIVDCVRDEYGLNTDQIAFLPRGADVNTAAYRLTTEDGKLYFLKLRKGAFDETCVVLPKFLRGQGIEQIIPPLETRSGGLWTNLEAFKTILYPYVEGRDGYEVELSERQWSEFGCALKRIHSLEAPEALTRHIQRESYSPRWCEMAKTFLERIEVETFTDPVAIKQAAFLRSNREKVLDLIGQAERLAETLRARPAEFVLCHGDLHAGNLLVDGEDALYIVDWDNPILAPKERDLMFIGGAQGFRGHTAQKEETLFYRGYGSAQVDPYALGYYRYERIVEDIAAFCEQVFSTRGSGDDREQSFRYLASNFLPNNTIETAYWSDKTRGR